MAGFRKWLFGTPEGSAVKIIATGLLGVLLSWLTTESFNPLIILSAPAIITPILNYLSADYTGYGRGAA